MNEDDDFQKCIDALAAIRLIRQHYASSPKSAELVSEVLAILRGPSEDQPAPGNLPRAVADAVKQSLLGGVDV